ncbi:K(+)-transporting ATPase subunit C [Cyanobacterium sp. IPPAS B-1200]|uniref:K(+)-transporting ATPase subunit C n=1 Tax=Cyanobacterium sp. IPPAS B-1200 TaxID=1562720 RepID=UPI0008524E03|nr:K(+)-transporting ATPase subunit C [Cyanobacterium sp. IPPAS B-1200]OEJ78156.1 potassium-transporting ATPase subunit C [Cyanobacterium sp. IPPAS B-1200]
MLSMGDFSKAIRATLILWLITGIIYPLFILIFGQVFIPYQANGSLIENEQGNIVGSVLIGQPFRGDLYFWSRPSVVNYSTGEDAGHTGVSGASNLAPSNPELMDYIATQLEELESANIAPRADLVYTSGSGLDPHISPQSAQNQMERIAIARNLTPEQLQELIEDNTEGRFLGIFGEPRVNVLQLNLALDNL